jgi:predicted acylesterase/phospholipase RssA
MSNPEPATSNPAASSPISSNPAAPILECDIVMKGGITSGVVYPLAVVELAKTYRFRNVGGTSAGAIAAAATAASELGRGKPNAGFEEFEALPGWLQETANDKSGSRLQALFQPQAKTKILFTIMLAALGPGNKFVNAGLAALKAYWPSVIVGVIPALVASWLLRSTAGLEVVFGVMVALILLAFGVLAMLLYRLFNSVTNDIPGNNFGLCNGYRPAEVEGKDPSLTEWLHRYLNRLAGRPADGEPLTFADLQAAGINLLMMTTNLTHGLPQRLPFETKLFFYNPTEFALLFPPAVIAHLEQYNQTLEAQGGSVITLPNGERLLHFPNGDDLPVVIAVRMSLSFPVLLSAIPLYTFDKAKTDPQPVAKRCWFSDGGLTSNFPVHFFDSPLPGRPTFAINLAPFEHDETPDTDESKNVWMPDTNKGGLKTRWNRFDQGSASSQLFGFFAAIFSTTQNWVDTSQLPMPGYRDRIAHVKLQACEGGLNLNMPATVINSLTERGRAAGQQLALRFANPNSSIELNWLNHRWVRYRATMASLETYLLALRDGYQKIPADGGPTYEALIKRGPKDPPSSYRLNVVKSNGFNIDQVSFADDTTRELMELIEQWAAKHQNKNAASFNSGNVPNPRAVLRAQPGGRVQDKADTPEEIANSLDM